jgi:fasciclin 1
VKIVFLLLCVCFFVGKPANTPNKMEHLKAYMLTEMDGNPPIYITKRRTSQGEEVYVNNAMILKSRSNVELKNEKGKNQVSRGDFSL